MRFEWDEAQNRGNRKKHGVSFQTATLVFEDPYALTKLDSTEAVENRFLTLGAAGPGVVLLVVHTSCEDTAEEAIRIISARPATSRERKEYEKTHKAAETRNRRYRKQTRPRH